MVYIILVSFYFEYLIPLRCKNTPQKRPIVAMARQSCISKMAPRLADACDHTFEPSSKQCPRNGCSLR